MLKLRLVVGIVLITLGIVTSMGCSDKTQTSENKALTKQRQELINSRKSQSDSMAAPQANKHNAGD